ncbi:TIGR02300 family protein [Marinivivus vitaminiproducens]|nr:TIGR02300 family protein [Geminicoccaceae bacterium SCSIO 64248]
MVKPEWGVKRVCQTCGARFYDLQKDPIVCPSCGATFDPETVSRTRRRSKPAVVEKKPAAVVEDEEDSVDAEDADVDEDAVTDDDEESEGLIEDASELGEDDGIPDVPDGEDDER